MKAELRYDEFSGHATEIRTALWNYRGVQVKMARVALGIGIRELAARAKVAQDTISRIERGDQLKERTVEAIRASLEAAGVEFLEGGGVRLRPSTGA